MSGQVNELAVKHDVACVDASKWFDSTLSGSFTFLRVDLLSTLLSAGFDVILADPGTLWLSSPRYLLQPQDSSQGSIDMVAREADLGLLPWKKNYANLEGAPPVLPLLALKSQSNPFVPAMQKALMDTAKQYDEQAALREVCGKSGKTKPGSPRCGQHRPHCCSRWRARL